MTLTIDLGTDTGPFHGGASGTLYGLYGDGVPSRNVVEGMFLRTVSTKAQDGAQHPGADALDILAPFVGCGGRDVYVYLTDIYRGFPYQWPGATGEERLAGYLTLVEQQVRRIRAAGALASHVVYVPFNEPEGNMFGTGEWSYDRVSWRTDPRHYFAAWKDAVRLIRRLDPDARVAGPNASVLYDEVGGFLEFAAAHDVLPDVITWHELSTPDAVRANVARYRRTERDLGIGPLPVNINEYAHNRHLSVPGRMVQWISAIEEAKVDADMAYWNIDGNLNDSVVEANKGNGQWWLFNAYGRMTGRTVRVTAPRPDVPDTLQGVATLDPDKRQARVLFGGEGGTRDLVLTNVPAGIFGETVHLRLHEIPWTGQVGPSAQPLRLRDCEVAVTEGRVVLRVTGLDAMSAYQVIASPGGRGSVLAPPSVGPRRTYAAENAGCAGTGCTRNGPEGSVADVERLASFGTHHIGGLRTGSDAVLAFEVEAPRDGTYDLTVFANSYNLDELVREQGPTHVFLRVDGREPRELRLPLAYKRGVWGRTDTRVRLTAGRHGITLAAQDPDLGETRGDASIDRIELALRDEHVEAPALYEAAYAVLDGGARVSHTHKGAAGPGAAVLPAGGTATFWVHADGDGEATVTVGRLGEGEGTLTVNGENLGSSANLRRPGARTDIPLFLAGGVNKLTVTATSDRLVLDRLLVGPGTGALRSTVHPAEEGVVTGTAHVTGAHGLATGGKAVDGIGGGAANALTLTVTAARAGRHALTVRYSNGEQAPATHYNPDPVCRHADLSVNGEPARRVLFPTTFHFNAFCDLTVPVTLREGPNTLTFTADVPPDRDGTRPHPDRHRGAHAPVIDQVTVTPVA
ncbi:cellulosome protein [Streptomyces sp. NPDC002688]|uniref:cellulosome protein n=1 Tax=Streptomyces sp. NPDC002688 TaxID=3154423 RepID=UPI0033213FD9